MAFIKTWFGNLFKDPLDAYALDDAKENDDENEENEKKNKRATAPTLFMTIHKPCIFLFMWLIGSFFALIFKILAIVYFLTINGTLFFLVLLAFGIVSEKWIGEHIFFVGDVEPSKKWVFEEIKAS